MKILIGVDDTDNLESRGTGFYSREMGRLLTENGLGRLITVAVTNCCLTGEFYIPLTIVQLALKWKAKTRLN